MNRKPSEQHIELGPDQSYAAQALELSKKVIHYSTPHWESGPPMRVDGAIMMHIMLLDSVMGRMANRDMEQHGLTFNQFIALGCIAHEPEGITHSQLGQRLMVSKTPVTSIVDRLEKMNLARRIPDPTDRRVSRIVITDAGRDRWQQVHERLQVNGPPEMPIPTEKQLELLTLLARLLDAVAQDDPIVTALREAPAPPEEAGEIFSSGTES